MELRYSWWCGMTVCVGSVTNGEPTADVPRLDHAARTHLRVKGGLVVFAVAVTVVVLFFAPGLKDLAVVTDPCALPGAGLQFLSRRRVLPVCDRLSQLRNRHSQRSRGRR